jgi:cytochrome c biogenesis protein ResB
MSADARTPPRPWRTRALAALRRPLLIVVELLAISLAAVLTATLPQVPDDDRVAAFLASNGWLGQLTATLGLHDVTRSWWFLALLGLALSSLLAVQWEQWRRLRRQWGERLSPAAFARTPWRAEAPADGLPRLPEAPRLATTGRIGQLGSPLFHLGLVLLVVAGGLRALTSADAMVKVPEGFALAPEASAYDVLRGGILARPFALDAPLRLEAVEVDWYDSGVLRQLSARLVLEPPASGSHELAINAPFDRGLDRLYLTQTWGVTALLQVGPEGRLAERMVFLEAGDEVARGTLGLGDGRELRLKADIRHGRADRLEVRAARDRQLLGLAQLHVDEAADLGDGLVVRLAGMPRWVQLRGSHDPSRWLFFAALVLALVGATLMMAIVRVDTMVQVVDGKLVVALRAARFAPLFADRFEELRKEWIP